VADNKACECGAILRGEKRPQPTASVFGTVMHAGEPDRLVHGVVRRRLRRPFMTDMPTIAEKPGATA
jgi:hypothetical protein